VCPDRHTGARVLPGTPGGVLRHRAVALLHPRRVGAGLFVAHPVPVAGLPDHTTQVSRRLPPVPGRRHVPRPLVVESLRNRRHRPFNPPERLLAGPGVIGHRLLRERVESRQRVALLRVVGVDRLEIRPERGRRRGGVAQVQTPDSDPVIRGAVPVERPEPAQQVTDRLDLPHPPVESTECGRRVTHTPPDERIERPCLRDVGLHRECPETVVFDQLFVFSRKHSRVPCVTSPSPTTCGPEPPPRIPDTASEGTLTPFGPGSLIPVVAPQSVSIGAVCSRTADVSGNMTVPCLWCRRRYQRSVPAGLAPQPTGDSVLAPVLGEFEEFAVAVPYHHLGDIRDSGDGPLCDGFTGPDRGGGETNR